MASIFCDVDVPDYVQLDCGTELGGIVAIALIAEDQNPSITDLQTASFWTQKLNVSPDNKYWLVTDTRGSYPGGTPTEEEGFGRVPTLRTGADHEATVEIRGVAENRNFMAAVNQTAKWNVVLVTQGNVGLYIEDASIYAKVVVDQSIKSSIRWMLSIKWSDDMSNPVVFDAPSQIFGE